MIFVDPFKFSIFSNPMIICIYIFAFALTVLLATQSLQSFTDFYLLKVEQIVLFELPDRWPKISFLINKLLPFLSRTNLFCSWTKFDFLINWWLLIGLTSFHEHSYQYFNERSSKAEIFILNNGQSGNFLRSFSTNHNQCSYYTQISAPSALSWSHSMDFRGN